MKVVSRFTTRYICVAAVVGVCDVALLFRESKDLKDFRRGLRDNGHAVFAASFMWPLIVLFGALELLSKLRAAVASFWYGLGRVLDWQERS